MSIEIRPLDTSTLLGMYRDVPRPDNDFRSVFTQSVFASPEEFIDFGKITEQRKLAPLVVPTAQGRPIYSESSRAYRFKPAYVKPKDPVSPERAIKRRPDENIFSPSQLTPLARFLRIVGDIMRAHREAIENRMEWLAAQAVIHGKVTLEGPDYPTTVVDFERDPNHTVTLTAPGAIWSNPDAPIIDQVNEWIETVRRAEFGGAVNRITLGRNVVGPFLKNKQVIEQMDTQYRGVNGDVNRGLRSGAFTEYLGRISGTEIWTTSDWYTKPDGSQGIHMLSATARS